MITITKHPDVFENAYWILTRNASKCGICGDDIESKHRHDYVSCTCGNVAVDGGVSYVRRAFRTTEFTDACLWTLMSADQIQATIKHYQNQDWADEWVKAGQRLLKEHYAL